MSLCYYCSVQATKVLHVTSLNGTHAYNVCKKCYFKVSYGFLQAPTGTTMPFPRYTKSVSSRQKEARLIYEESLSAYSLKFTYDKNIVEFVKKVIPSHERTTSGPPDWIWYFDAKYFDVIRTLFEGHRDFKLTIVTKEEVEAIRAKHEQESQHVYRPQQFSINEELQKFYDLLWPVGVNNGSGLTLDQVKNWNRTEAVKYYRIAATKLHPDRNGGDGSKMSELNSVWALLKEGYYIK